MKKRNLHIILTLLSVALLLCGCGKQKDSPYTAQAMEALASLEYEEALNLLDQAILDNGDMREIYRGQGLAYLGLTRYEEAATAFENCLSVSSAVPDDMDYDVNYYLAVAYMKLSNYAEAEKIYSAVLDLRPKEKDAWMLRGVARLKQGDYENAKGDFDKTLELAPDEYDRLITVFEALSENGYKEVGQAYLTDALQKAGESKTMSNYEKGRLYYYLEDFESARNYLEQARNAGDAQATYYLGKTWENLGEYNYAASVYTSYLKEQEESALIYNQLAMCQLELGNCDAALEAVEKGIAMEDNSLRQTLLFNRIVIREKQGEFKEAAALIESYCKSYPDDAQAAREREFLRSR